MSSPLETDPRFWVLSEALASYASDADDPPPRDHDTMEAAVSLVLRGREYLDLLVIKRARSDRDPWSGHMALPGGRRDPGDLDLVATAIRETREETSVDLSSGSAHLGRLDQVATQSPRLPKLTIDPFVFGVTGDAVARVASKEIAQVYWVSLEELRAPETHGSVGIPLPGGVRSFPCYRVEGEVIWGLTYRILEQFLRLYPPPSTPR
ncbi:MAG: CoA pyrophosphatase [Gemmatimonadota bacterium]|nr:CoA pyrophosphatase [Gemmatimonadota bacterium]MDH5759868.1 CoA pyrophosphatase [Gemmatimonadota bacterium]